MGHVQRHKNCLLFRATDVCVEASNKAYIVHEMAPIVNTALQNGDRIYLFKRVLVQSSINTMMPGMSAVNLV